VHRFAPRHLHRSSCTPVRAASDVSEGYGLSSESRLLVWADVDARLAAALHYWISTVSRSMTPHPRPIDGMWIDQRLYFGGDPESKWQRNLASNQAAAVHLDDLSLTPSTDVADGDGPLGLVSPTASPTPASPSTARARRKRPGRRGPSPLLGSAM